MLCFVPVNRASDLTYSTCTLNDCVWNYRLVVFNYVFECVCVSVSVCVCTCL